MSAARKQAVFNVASKWDVIIVEDDRESPASPPHLHVLTSSL